MVKRVILDLCSGTGAWSKAYQDSKRYNVKLITLPDYDIREYRPPRRVHGILAAPPCTHFTNSGAQYWAEKDADGRTLDDLEIVTGCLRIIIQCKPRFWALENPVGRLRKWMGKPRIYFNPCDYGDPYTKKTCLWGNFNIPEKSPVTPEFVIAANGDRYSKIHWSTGGKSDKTKEVRSITPPGFAKAFMEANP